MIHLKSRNRDPRIPRKFAALVEPTELEGKPIRNEEMLAAAVSRAGAATIRLLDIDWTPGALVTMSAGEFLNDWTGD